MMEYSTDRKRVIGLGSAKTGTEHHWHMMISSAALCGLIPMFVLTFGSICLSLLKIIRLSSIRYRIDNQRTSY